MELSENNIPIGQNHKRWESVFPSWANEAYLDPVKMDHLREYIRKQVEHNEPKYTRRNKDGSTMEISKDKNSGIYKIVVNDRVTGIIGAFFNPIELNKSKIIKKFSRNLF